MEKKLTHIFDYQRFDGNKELASLIEETENRFKALSEDELLMVSAAGFPSPTIDPERVVPLKPEEKRREKEIL